ncbi:MAG TPA: TRAP transporter small permease subunit [Paracoccus sp. (in: a-proteobacteria)]|uniref:TRAP transporter small permease n=1 Tax=Paracoccus sp. TaxID=267 RepID=UPI002CD19BDE|nr:TRAP transporter small permease subunit [Paracoccus sp. (in: a-proteobacteria)]HWL56609.1 TRAP transporter small permease subunit [Paracoccus sp. (in: a-proteobacteria)]
MSPASLTGWLARRAENALVLMLLVMFLVFLLQIVSRYLLNLPIGWTHEVSVMLWIWLVLFGAAFVLSDDEEMRFDLFYRGVGDRARRVMVVISAIATVAAFAVALPATWDYVTFMKVEKSAYLRIRFDWLYSIYVLFAVAMIFRQLWIGFRAIYGRAPDQPDPLKPSSGL